jgi:hypothetical protein
MKNGRYCNAQNVYLGSKVFSDLISDDDLVFLTDANNYPPMWVASPRQINNREYKFIESLNITQWGVEELIVALNSFNANNVYDQNAANKTRSKFNQWISVKDDVWLAKFYNILGEHFKPNSLYLYKKQKPLNIDKLKFIKAKKLNFDSYTFCYPSEVYTSIEDEQSIDNIFIAKIDEKFKINDEKFIFDDIRHFYKYLEIKLFDTKEALCFKIEAMQKDETRFSENDEKYYQFIKECINYSKNSNADMIIFEGKHFLLATDHENKKWWAVPSQIFIDDPFYKTNLSKPKIVFQTQYFLSEIYKSYFVDTELELFIDFLRKTKCIFFLPIVETVIPAEVRRQILKYDDIYAILIENYNMINKDFSINNIQKILIEKTNEISLLLWNSLSNSDFNYHQFEYAPNKSTRSIFGQSTLVKKLIDCDWLPNKAGVFFKPCDIHWEDLHDEFRDKRENKCFQAFLEAIEFGKHAKLRDEGYVLRDEAAKKLGFKSADAAEDAKEVLALFSPEEIAERKAQKDEDVFPSHPVPNTTRRTQLAESNANNANTRNYEPREFSTNTSRSSSDSIFSKLYLRSFYTDDTGAMRCQCCEYVMPFRLKGGTGEYYFVDVQITKVTKEHTNYRLALCPTCAAMYRHANDQTDEAIQAKLLACKLDDGAGNAAINIQLAGKPRQLRFVAKHLIDVKAILKVGV